MAAVPVAAVPVAAVPVAAVDSRHLKTAARLVHAPIFWVGHTCLTLFFLKHLVVWTQGLFGMRTTRKSSTIAFFDPMENRLSVFGVAVLLKPTCQLFTRFDEQRVHLFRPGFQREFIFFNRCIGLFSSD